jgi:hypothetical protein
VRACFQQTLAWTIKAGSQQVDDIHGRGVWRKGAEVDEY